MTPKGTNPKKSAATQDPVNRTILLLDIERYSDRDDVEQGYLRRMLYEIADRTLYAAGIDATRRLRADRGDSVMELIDANASLVTLLRTVLSEVPVQLRTTNRKASSSAQIRLRAVLATGYVAIDQDGWVGSDLNMACRLLDASLLREALRKSDDDFALCVSDSVHQGIVRHNHPGIPTEKFHPVVLEGKNGPMGAWLYGTDAVGADGPAGRPSPQEGTPTSGSPAPASGSPAPAAAPPSASATERGGTSAPSGGSGFHFNGGNPSFGGALVAGSQYGIAGGTFQGPVHLDGTESEEEAK